MPACVFPLNGDRTTSPVARRYAASTSSAAAITAGSAASGDVVALEVGHEPRAELHAVRVVVERGAREEADRVPGRREVDRAQRHAARGHVEADAMGARRAEAQRLERGERAERPCAEEDLGVGRVAAPRVERDDAHGALRVGEGRRLEDRHLAEPRARVGAAEERLRHDGDDHLGGLEAAVERHLVEVAPRGRERVVRGHAVVDALAPRAVGREVRRVRQDRGARRGGDVAQAVVARPARGGIDVEPDDRVEAERGPGQRGGRPGPRTGRAAPAPRARAGTPPPAAAATWPTTCRTRRGSSCARRCAWCARARGRRA